ncbi:HAD family hydrolase [Mangrovimicrobium sediminis]|uniref:HAD family hydrolase n=1 Tax=Mangrovimicrobium sediminis TaxID=2562682 RepID=UPI001F0F22BD|nr:HAD family hydrolase [Haliea sp. SAOS-164]
MQFVTTVTDAGSDGFVPPAERIATFDNDGTLWSEQPLYFQGYFALQQIRDMAPDHPEWKEREPYRSVLANDLPALLAHGKAGLMEVLLTAHSGMTADEFVASVARWREKARHPGTGKPFTQMVYQPMLELLDYLRDNDFKVYIVSGGGVDFMRVFAEEVYGVPPEQVVGSTLDATLEMRDGIPTIVKAPKLVLIDDKAGKPVGIYRHIGRRPILAGGNSDGDLQMLEYTTVQRSGADTTPRLGLIVHHTDAEREYAYDRDSHMGRLDKALDVAPERGWLVVDMKRDWKRVYPGEQ